MPEAADPIVPAVVLYWLADAAMDAAIAAFGEVPPPPEGIAERGTPPPRVPATPMTAPCRPDNEDEVPDLAQGLRAIVAYAAPLADVGYPPRRA